jgi:hypothetical protein
MDDPLAFGDSPSFVDEDVLHGVTAGDGGVESPYSQFGTLVAKVRTLFPFLVDVARDRDCTDFGTISRECGIHAARLGPLLDVVGHHEARLDRPLLPAVVRPADREMPRDRYFDLVERAPTGTSDVPTDPAERRWLWETQRDAVYRTWVERGHTGSAHDRRVPAP